MFVTCTLALSLVLNLTALSSFPPPHCDESTYGSIAFELLRSGQFKSEMTGDLFGLNQYNSAVGRLWILGMALVIKLFGVQLLAARFYSLLGGIVVVWLSYLVAKELRDRSTGILAALLVSFSWKIFYAAHMARPEIWLAVSVLFALFWLIRRARDMTQARESVLAGIICVLPLEFHALGVFFLAGFLVAAGYYFGWISRSWRLLAGFVMGVVFGALIWIAIHFFPNPNLAWMQWTLGISQMDLVNPPSLLFPLREFGTWFATQFISNNRFLGLVETFIYLIGLVYVLRLRSKRGMIIGLVGCGSLLAFALSPSQKSPQYAVVWVPLLSILFAHACASIGTDLARRGRVLANLQEHWAQLILVTPVLVIFLAGNLWLTIRYPRSGYEHTLALMRPHVPEGAVILGDPLWWWGFAEEGRYIGDWYLAAQAQVEGGIFDVREELERLGATYVILDDYVACTLERSPVDKQLRSVLSHQCRLKASIEGPWHDHGDYESQFQFGQVSDIYACGPQL